MIVSKTFLAQISEIHRTDLFEGQYAKHVSKWCIDYYDEYEEAPREDIQSIFESKANEIDPDVLDSIEDFLNSISKEYERSEENYNSEYILDKSIEFFKKRALSILTHQINSEISTGNTSTAEDFVFDYISITKIKKVACEPFKDTNSMEELFDNSAIPLFKYPGSLGKMINNDLCRDSFVAFMGPEKRGKTWILMDLAIRAYKSHNNVAFFQAGDMTEQQQKMRMYIYNTQRSNREQYCGTFLIPVLDCYHNQDDTCNKEERIRTGGVLLNFETGETVEFKDGKGYIPCTCCKVHCPKDYKGAVWYKEIHNEVLDWETATAEANKISDKCKSKLKLSTHPNRSLTVRKIKSILNEWELTEDFVPDVIVVDYADIMLHDSSTTDFRHQQNQVWQDLRGLSQEWHCLVVTATQADADSYDRKYIKMKNFSEDKRKFGHVTSMIALNQTPEEKRKGVMRMSMLVMRDDEFDTERQVTVLQSLRIGRPILGSY